MSDIKAKRVPRESTQNGSREPSAAEPVAPTPMESSPKPAPAPVSVAAARRPAAAADDMFA
jgi:hypothetical protein